MPVLARGLVAALALAVAGCAAPDPRPLDRAAILAEIDDRSAPASLDPTTATALNPEVRAAERRLVEARARARSAGWPGPVELEVGRMNLEDGDAPTEVALGLDLVGLLGLEPVQAEATLARAEVALAGAELAAARRAAGFDRRRAEIRLAATRARAARLGPLHDEAAQGLRRVDALFRAGRVGDGLRGRAGAMTAAVGERVLAARAESHERAAALARTAGLGPEAPALAEYDGAHLERAVAAVLATTPIAPTVAEIHDRHPEVAVRRVRHALAEARLAREAARTWPGVRLGSRLEITSSDVVPGGLLGLAIPFPGSLEGEIAAADEARESARQELVDELLALWNEAHAARERRGLLALRLDGEMARRLEAAGVAWRGAAARLRVEDRGAEMWTDALMSRAEAVAAATEAEMELVLADLDLLEASGADAEGSR